MLQKGAFHHSPTEVFSLDIFSQDLGNSYQQKRKLSNTLFLKDIYIYNFSERKKATKIVNPLLVHIIRLFFFLSFSTALYFYFTEHFSAFFIRQLWKDYEYDNENTHNERRRERGGRAGCIDKSPHIFGLIDLPDIVT